MTRTKKLMSLTISIDVLEALKIYAEERDWSLSQAANNIIKAYLKDKENNK